MRDRRASRDPRVQHPRACLINSRAGGRVTLGETEPLRVCLSSVEKSGNDDRQLSQLTPFPFSTSQAQLEFTHHFPRHFPLRFLLPTSKLVVVSSVFPLCCYLCTTVTNATLRPLSVWVVPSRCLPSRSHLKTDQTEVLALHRLESFTFSTQKIRFAPLHSLVKKGPRQLSSRGACLQLKAISYG